jgi:hypothetical protein
MISTHTPKKTPNLPDFEIVFRYSQVLKDFPARSQNKKGFLKFSTSISGL